MTRKILTYILLLAALTACHKSHEEEEQLSERTVLIYMSGENNLTYTAGEDLREILRADINAKDDYLLVYVDQLSSTRMPYLARVRNGRLVDSVSVADMGISDSDPYSSDPAVMSAVMSYAFQKYPSRNYDYGLVLWGHASGWVIENDTIATEPAAASARRRAYGIDGGDDSGEASIGSRWMNISQLAEALLRGPHLKFILADCCNFQCLESLYELRHTADYIIGSPAEIPDVGAPYATLVPALFDRDSFYVSIVDRYYEQVIDGTKRTPLSVVKTSEMDQLATATRDVLLSMRDTLRTTNYPNVKGLIHYYYSPLFNDANDFVLRYATPEAYATWKAAFDRAVIVKKMATRWTTNINWSNYSDFTMTEERYGGVSMFVPVSPSTNFNYYNYNRNIGLTAWYAAAGLSELGW